MKTLLLPYAMGILYAASLTASVENVTWRGHYKDGFPTKSHVTAQYCQAHSPGIFTHSVEEGLKKPMITEKGITLTHPTFNQEKVNRIYLIYGDITAIGKGKTWKDRIHYFFYKFSKYGTTRGVWYTDKCKGHYIGTVINQSAFG